MTMMNHHNPSDPQWPEPLPITLETLARGAGLTLETDSMPASDGLRGMLMTAPQLACRPVAPRPKVLGEWLREGDLGYLFAPRGHGKTWLAMLLGQAISCGVKLGEWTGSGTPRRVVYFDAEMNLPDVQQRSAMIGIDSPRFVWLQNEVVFEKLRRGLNITTPVDQALLSVTLEDGDVFLIDNLSTAASGMKENDNDDFDLLKDWLLELRGRRITVIIVHHAGRNGEMRGASRREDMAHWILSLKDDSTDASGDKAFVTHFRKCRNCAEKEAPSLRWSLRSVGSRLTYTCAPHSGPEAMLDLIRAGVETASELAEELGVTPGCVSKWARRLTEQQRIRIKGRRYELIA